MSIRKLGAVAIVAIAAVSLTGCFKSTAQYTLHEDDTVSGEFVIGLAKDFAEGLSPEEATQNVGGNEVLEGIEDVDAKPYDDGRFVGTIYTFENQPLATVAAGIDGTLVRDGDLFVFQGNPIDSSELEGMEQFLDQAEASLSITFPGKVTDTNGSVSGTTVTWNLLTQTEAPYATGGAIGTGDSGDDGMPSWVWIAIVGGAIVLVGVIVMLSRRSKDEVAEAAPAEKKAPAKKAPAKKPTDKK